MKLPNMNITTRLLVWFLVIALVPFLIFMLVVTNIVERNTRADVFDTLEVAADNQLARLENYVQNEKVIVELLARQSFLTSSMQTLEDPLLIESTRVLRKAQVREYFRQILPRTHFDDIALVSVDGEIMFSLSNLTETDIHAADFPFSGMVEAVDNSISNRISTFSRLMPDPPNGTEIAFVTSPIFVSSRLVGVLVGRLHGTGLYEIVTNRTGLGETGETNVGILQGNEVIFTAPTRNDPDAAFNIRITLGGQHGQAMQQAVRNTSGQGELIDYRGTSVIAVWRYVPSMQWGLVVKQDTAEAFAPLIEQRRALIPIMVITIVFVTTVAFFVARTFTRPVHKLTQAVEWMTAGNLSTRVGDMKAGDEFNMLGRGFDHMARELDDLVGSLEKRIAERTRQLENFALEMATARTQAESANTAKTIFLTNMSHELRTPLNAILGFAQMLQTDRAVPVKQREHIGTIARSGEHLLGLINELLDMARIESGQIVLAESAFDLRYLLRGVEEMMTLRADAKSLQLEFEIADDVPQFIRADEGKLRQVIINLVGNGIKFTDEGGVSVRCGIADGHLRFEIEDTGPGIPDDEIDKLFQPFSQTEIGAKAQEGTGLGLAISRAYMRAMGGGMSVTSTVGQGTIFAFDLPLILASSEEVRTGVEYNRRPTGIMPPNDTREWRILVVDDKPENRQLMRLWMEEVGFQVREAANGQEAVSVWDSWEPHLIWMDMRMPVLNGYEATRQIKATVRGNATAVIALTASALDGERQLVMSAGCDDFVRKPARVSTIFEKLEQHLGIRFAYDDSSTHDDPAASNLTLSRETLATLPESWRNKLHEAVQKIDLEGANRLASELDITHPVIARELQDLIKAFRFDTLQELI